jgi:hypothetical protein
MPTVYRLNPGLSLLAFLATVSASGVAVAQQTPFFTPGNLVVVVSGCGVQGSTCTISGGTGDGTGNSTAGGYGDNQGTPLTLFQFAPTGTTSATYVNSLVLPQSASGSNLPVSAEYGSSSEGTLQLSGNGQYLTVMGYGINAATYNANPAAYGTLASKPTALAQSGSLTGQSYTPVGRVIALIDPNANVNSTSAIFNVFNLNNPRSVYTADGFKAYISGQGSGSDATGGVFYTPLFTVNNAPTAITGLDTAASSSATTNTVSQDTRTVQIYNNTLYVSVDSKGGSNNTRSFIGTLGTPPATSLYNSGSGPTQLVTSNNASMPVPVTNNGKLTLTASETNGINSAGQQINLSPSAYYFANAYTLYIADTGNSKQTSATSKLGDGGLQKWVNTKADGSGTWQLMYTVAAGLNLVQNPSANSSNTSGTTGLYSLAGTVSNGNVYLYAVNSTIGDLDQDYLYGITDSLAATTNPGNSFTKLATAPPDSNFRGVSFAPSYPAGSATITTVPSGLSITTAGTGCVPGTYVTPITLTWTPGSVCTLSTTTPQSPGSAYTFSQWQDGTTSTTDSVVAPSTSATYTATFASTYQPVGVLERAVDNSTASTSVLQGDSLLVSGWVADQVDGSPLGNIKVYVDGTLFGTPTTGISRTDVASTYGSTYANSGYSLVASTSSLSTGYHNVTVVAVDSTSRSTTFGPIKINLVSTPPAYVFLSGSGSVGSLGSTGAQTSAAVAGGGTGAAVDASGYVWSINANGTSLSSFTPAGALSASYSPSGLTGASALAIDGNSNIVVANGNGALSIVANAGTTTSTTQGSTSAAPSGVAIDLSGDVWVANSSTSTVDEIIGGAAPVAPLASSVKNTTPATKP